MPGLSSAKAADSAQIKDIRLSKNQNYVRLVFHLDNVADHSIFSLAGPDRVVLESEINKSHMVLVDRVQANSLIRSIRSGIRNDNDLGVVFDLSEEVSPRSFLLAPSRKSGHRLVIDLHDKKDTSKRLKGQ